MLKRTFDILISTLVLFTLFPFSLLIAMLIKLDSPGPVLHRAIRVGKDSKLFTLYKFRTPGLSSVEGMVADATSRGPGITQQDDPRISRVGRILRKLKTSS